MAKKAKAGQKIIFDYEDLQKHEVINENDISSEIYIDGKGRLFFRKY